MLSIFVIVPFESTSCCFTDFISYFEKDIEFFSGPCVISLLLFFFFFPFLSFSYESRYVLSLHFVEFPDCVRAVEITYRNNLTSGLQGTETGEELDILLGCSEPQAPIEHSGTSDFLRRGSPSSQPAMPV